MFRLPPEIIAGITAYQEQLKAFVEGRLSAARFKSLRVPWGIYSQRGGIIHMCRLRIPGGWLAADQMRAVAAVARKYGDGSLHVTTRQDIQVHGVKIEDTGPVLNYLKEFDISPRGGGGNTVRNIMACPRAGICPKEAFDVRPYAIGLSEYILGLESSYTLPRKYKIAFSGCPQNCLPATVTDLGFIARKELPGREGDSLSRNVDLSFRVYAGGGMGASSRKGEVLEEAIKPADAGYVAEAVKRVFARRGNRKNRHHNRLRFLIEEVGFARFEVWYREEIKKLKAEEDITLRRIVFPPPPGAGRGSGGERGDYRHGNRFNVREQKQAGLYSLEVRLPLGLIDTDQMEGLAELATPGRQIEFRTTPTQNILIANLPGSLLLTIYDRLRELNLAQSRAATILDPVCCAGATTCNLGFCDSRAAAAEISTRLAQSGIDPGKFPATRIHIGGCPNACAQHPIGPVGLHGLVRRVGARPVPFYSIQVGGDQREGSTCLGEEIGVVPARNLPRLLEEFFRKAEKSIKEYEDFYQYLAGEGKKQLRALIEDYSYIPLYEEDRSFYRDWGKEEDFTLAGIGPGECGAGVMDLIDDDLRESENLLDRAQKTGPSRESIKQSIYLSARALLVVKGLDPKSPEEAIGLFRRELVEAGICSPRFSDLGEFWRNLETADCSRARRYAEDLLQEVRLIYREMDDRFNLKVRYKPSDKSPEERSEGIVLDLRGVSCPLNYVKAKLYLETSEVGDDLTIYLDGGDPIRNVPLSLKNDGQEIVSIAPAGGGYFRLRVIKRS